MAERRANGEGSKILLHKSGQYYSKVSLSCGRRVDVYGQTRDEVKNKRHTLLERDRLGLMTAPDKITALPYRKVGRPRWSGSLVATLTCQRLDGL